VFLPFESKWFRDSFYPTGCGKYDSMPQPAETLETFVLSFILLAVPGFELRASHLLGSYITTLTTPPDLFTLIIIIILFGGTSA
jgi:hypothetical protein